MFALGPAFVAAVAYVDPGNVATNVSAGSEHGFLLLWVVVLATLMAGPVQYLSAKLGIVARMSLPSYVASRTSRRARIAYWLQAELVAVATDVAELIGAAVAMNLLFHIPLVLSGVLTSVVSMAVLIARDRWGARLFEFCCVVSLFAIGVGFLSGVLRHAPGVDDLVGGLDPKLDGWSTVVLAAGIVGATVMPHAVYLHSSLTAESAATDSDADTRSWLRWAHIDVATAMLIAGSINVSMLLLGATALQGNDDASFGGVAHALTQRLGHGAGTAFLVALLVSGLSSTAVGTQAGASIMDGLMHRQVPNLVRRCITLVPALALLASGRDPLSILVFSQVVLALGLPFALIPLLRATADKAVMGARRNHVAMSVVVGLITIAVIALDLALVVLTFTGGA